MSEISENTYIDKVLLVGFVKYILSQIYNHCIWNFTFRYFPRLWKLLLFQQNIFKNFLH